VVSTPGRGRIEAVRFLGTLGKRKGSQALLLGWWGGGVRTGWEVAKISRGQECGGSAATAPRWGSPYAERRGETYPCNAVVQVHEKTKKQERNTTTE